MSLSEPTPFSYRPSKKVCVCDDALPALEETERERDEARNALSAAQAEVQALREVLAPLAEFAEATIAIDAHYANGNPIMTTDMAREWPLVCERAQAALDVIAAQPAAPKGAAT